MPNIHWAPASIATLMTTELDSLASGSAAERSADYTQSPLVNQAIFELAVDFASAPSAGNIIELWYRQNMGNGLEDATTGATPRTPQWGPYCFLVPVNASAFLMCSPPLLIPAVAWRPFLVNKSGQAFPSSGSTLKIIPLTEGT